MKRLTIIGALVVALVIPASALGKGIPRLHNVRAVDCAKTVVIMPGRDYGVCGGNLWFRYGQAGGLTTGPAFWRHERTDRPDDHP
jgi:hypothetical protein